mgnify:FL=1
MSDSNSTEKSKVPLIIIILLLLMVLIAPVVFFITLIIHLGDRPDCLNDISKLEKECEEDKSNIDCSKVNEYCKNDGRICEFDRSKAVADLCSEEYEKRKLIRIWIMIISGIISIFEGVAISALYFGATT